MDLRLNETQEMIRRSVRDFAEREVAPLARELDEQHRFPHETVGKLAEMGLMGMLVPETYGGAGFDGVSYALAMEEISRACASTAVIMSVNNSLVCMVLLKHGTEEQKRAHLVPLARGERLGCYALSEPGSGSDAAAMTCVARADGDGYRITGTKNFITNGREADQCVLFALTDPAKRHKGITCFLVDLDGDGVSVGKVEDKLGIRGSSTTSLVFEDAYVPGDRVLGTVGEGFKIAMATLDGGRIGIASQALGIGRAALEAAVRYTHERKAFGKFLHELQAIQFMIADMATRLDAARLLIWRAAWLKDQGERVTRESAMAKLFASEAAHFAVDKALQIHGGYGFCREFDVERYYRDQRITEIYEGTSEIQRLVIARETLKRLA